ncbi:MAG TPA: serine/threonine-protein kinase, partial [Usitatibacter sp.]|nr:serine/threonine-protein kinase [Usitatibacter sp.]
MSVPERIGKYEVQAVLGKGAMGTVYRGFDATIQRFVALKVIAKSALEPDDLEHTLRRFRQEAQAVGRLMHPRIAAIYDFIETDELACIVMELASGKPLSQHLKEVTRYDLGQTWQIASQILGALEYCHSRGVVHRDLKPANILIDDDFRIKITDFGVARIDNSSLTQFGDLIGTPHYMAPEQCVSGQCTSLTDLYQVGVIVYELLTGEPPFVGTTAEVLRQVLQKSPPDPSQLNPSIPPSLAKVVEKALAKEPRGRYTSARTLAEALKESIESSLGVALASAPPDSAQAVSVSANLLDNARLLAAGAEDPEEGGAGSGAIFAAVADSKKARVLFVDDDERILNALRALFKAHYHVFTAENGALALEIVKRFDIHVIVSDQRM